MRKILIMIFIITITTLFSFEISNPDSVNKVLNKFAENIGNVEEIEFLNIEYNIYQIIYGNDLTFWSSVQIEFPDNVILKFANYTIEINGNKAYRRYKDGFYEKLSSEISDKFRQPLTTNIVYLAKFYKQLEFELIESIINEMGQFYKITNKDKTLSLYIDKTSYIVYRIDYYVDNKLRIKRFKNYTTSP